MPSDKRDPQPGSVQSFRLTKAASTENIAPTQVLNSIVSGSTAQVVLAVAAVLAICYAGKLPLITLCIALLVAFVLAPISDLFERWRTPRWASSFVAVFLLLAGLFVIGYFSYNKAMQFVEDLPSYSQNIRQTTQHFRQQAEKNPENHTRGVSRSEPAGQ